MAFTANKKRCGMPNARVVPSVLAVARPPWVSRRSRYVVVETAPVLAPPLSILEYRVHLVRLAMT